MTIPGSNLMKSNEMNENVLITTPLDQEQIRPLKSGDQCLISGVIYAARDAAHKRMIQMLDAGQSLPVNLEGQIIYYVGPAPAKPGMPIGSAGPTTSGRMDRYTPRLLEAGLKGMIGKGYRSREVRDSIQSHGAVYFAAIGGSGALLARRITASRIIAFEDLGPEAIYELTVESFPVFVINDAHGNDLYETAPSAYRK
jgi:fumarate hydratase subunit beta